MVVIQDLKGLVTLHHGRYGTKIRVSGMETGAIRGGYQFDAFVQDDLVGCGSQGKHKGSFM